METERDRDKHRHREKWCFPIKACSYLYGLVKIVQHLLIIPLLFLQFTVYTACSLRPECALLYLLNTILNT